MFLKNRYFFNATYLILEKIHPILSLFESYKTFVSEDDNKLQPIFIIGAPRSGSTILYQGITNYYDLLYPDNLCFLMKDNFGLGVRLSQKLYGKRPHNVFKSVAGRTEKFGLHAPAEVGQYWIKYFKYLPEKTNLMFGSLMHHYQKPIIIKNVMLSTQLQSLYSEFPHAKVIYLKRDTVDNAMSILSMQEKLGLNLDDWWSCKPSNFQKLLYSSPQERVVKQVEEINKEIEANLNIFPEENILRLDYGELKGDADHPPKSIQKFFAHNAERRPSGKFPVIEERKNVESQLAEKFVEFVNKDKPRN